MEKLVVNIIGLPGSGKSTACNDLTAHGFEIIRPSNVLRFYAQEHGIPLSSRQDYIDLHHQLNKTNPYAVIEPVFISISGRICVDGLRSPAKLNKLQTVLGHVITIALDCPPAIRLARTQADAARYDTHRTALDLRTFLASEQPDRYNSDRFLPNMDEMMQRADYHIDASQPASLVRASLDAIIAAELPRLHDK